jgi:NADPH2:quinone reductase
MKIKAVAVSGRGGPEVLKLRDVELDWPRGAGEVLIELTAAALNPADVYFRKFGGYVEGPAPLVLGHDGAGVVRSVGSQVRSVAAGDRVCFCNGGIGRDLGTYAEAAVVPEWQLAKIPSEVDDLTAAAVPLVTITAWEAMYDRAKTEPGDFVLVHAGAGGTGHVALQFAVLRGARVATTVSSAEKAEVVKDLGAEHIINYRKSDFADSALKWSGSGLNVALDNVGAETLQKSFRAMAPYGRVVTLMGTPADDVESNAYNLNLTIHNVMMLTPMWRRLETRLREQAEILGKSLKLVAERKLRILQAATFQLSEVAEAHAFLESGKAIGKVTLKIRS